MFVIKRDGSQEELDIMAIRKQTIPACEGLDGVSYEELELSTHLFFKDGIRTEDIQRALIDTARDKVSADSPNWSYVAGRLTLYDLYHKIKKEYNKKGRSGDIYSYITLQNYIEHNECIFSDWFSKYSKEEIEELNKCIDSSRDLLYNQSQIGILLKMYLAKKDGNISELPQHMHMAISMFIMQNETNNRLEYVKELYNSLSNLHWINPTPINSNGRLNSGTLISCLINIMDDNRESIMNKIREIAIGSAQGAGYGVCMSKIRSLGSTIAGRPNSSGGKVPFMKMVEYTCLAFNQGGRRPGSAAIYIECWDIDIFNFINTKNKSGEERTKVEQVYPAVIYNDEFMKRLESDTINKTSSTWTLFDPQDTPDLVDLYGEEFSRRYKEYEEEFKNNPSRFNPNTNIVTIKQILKEHIIKYTESGMPFVMHKCNVNRQNPNKHLGMIYSSNLCVEILLPTSSKYTAVCNLGAINLSRVGHDMDLLQKTIKIGIRAMDNSIELSDYPSEESKRFQSELRTVGMGSVGEAELIAEKKIMYGSQEHKEFADMLWRTISETAHNVTQELAKEKGSCQARPGYRNSYLMAIAPNSTSAVFAGTTNGLEPVFAKYWIEESNGRTFGITAPNITEENEKYYINAFEVDPFDYLDVAAIRQKYVDMGMSINLFIHPERSSTSLIRDLILYSWKKGLKTLYYLRSQPPTNTDLNEKLLVKRNTEIKCVGCEN